MRAPYRHVVTYGWALDEHGRPMSKSLGNIVLPSEICDKYGADILRLWVAAHDYTADMRMSENVMKQLSEAYRKIRNTFRYVLSNLNDFDPARDAVPAEKMWELDRWMLERTAALASECRGCYDAFEFHRMYHALHDFAVVELSAFYFDILKDRLYTFGAESGRAAFGANCGLANCGYVAAIDGADYGFYVGGSVEIFSESEERACDGTRGFVSSGGSDWNRIERGSDCCVGKIVGGARRSFESAGSGAQRKTNCERT